MGNTHTRQCDSPGVTAENGADIDLSYLVTGVCEAGLFFWPDNKIDKDAA